MSPGRAMTGRDLPPIDALSAAAAFAPSRRGKTRSYDPEHVIRPGWTYLSLDHAYDYFGEELFGGVLPRCLITLQRHRSAYGYFSGDRFAKADDPAMIVDEIALNPAHFARQTVAEVLSTLVHEMAHLWQHHHGKPGRGRYHNREWARKMNDLGLPPSDTGQPGGKQVGERMSHYIRTGGPFDLACRAYAAAYPTILFQDRAYTDQAGEEKAIQVRQRKLLSKTPFDCPRCCDQRAWAKPSASLICGVCDEVMQSVACNAERY